MTTVKIYHSISIKHCEQFLAAISSQDQHTFTLYSQRDRQEGRLDLDTIVELNMLQAVVSE